jgi:hypothetical protein
MREMQLNWINLESRAVQRPSPSMSILLLQRSCASWSSVLLAAPLLLSSCGAGHTLHYISKSLGHQQQDWYTAHCGSIPRAQLRRCLTSPGQQD